MKNPIFFLFICLVSLGLPILNASAFEVTVTGYEEALQMARARCESPSRIVPTGNILSSMGRGGETISVIDADFGDLRGRRECALARDIFADSVLAKAYPWYCAILDSNGNGLGSAGGSSMEQAFSSAMNHCLDAVQMLGYSSGLCHQAYGVPCFRQN